MKLVRTLQQLQKNTECYVHGAKAGRRDRLLAALLFELCDAIRQMADSESAKAVAVRISTGTEELVRLAYARESQAFYAAWARQRDAIVELRAIIASEGAR